MRMLFFGRYLVVKIFNQSPSHNEYFLFKIKNKLLDCNYSNRYVFPYENIDIAFENLELTLNRNDFKKGDLLKGQLTITLNETIFYKNEEPSTSLKAFEGDFQVVIQGE